MYYIYHIYYIYIICAIHIIYIIYILYASILDSKSMDTLTWNWYPTNLRIMRRKYALVMFGFSLFEDWRINYFWRGIMCRKHYFVIFGSSLFIMNYFLRGVMCRKYFLLCLGTVFLWTGILSTS